MSSGSKAQTVGYWYRPTFEVVPCSGPVDAVRSIEAGSVVAWSGNQTTSGTIAINQPALWGGEASEGGVQGDMLVRMGDGAQATLEDGQRHRGVLSLRWSGGRWGAMNPYPKPLAVQVERILDGWPGGTPWYPEKAPIVVAEVEFPEVWLYRATLANNDVTGYIFESQAVAAQHVYDEWALSPPATKDGWTISPTSPSPGQETVVTCYYVSDGIRFEAFERNIQGQLQSAPPTDLLAINPAHLIYFSLVSPTMQGEPDTLIDEASFEEAADIFFAEGLGVCTLWDPDQETVEALRARICDAAGAACSRRPSDGKWTLRAIRGASGTLPVLTDDDIIDLQIEPGVLDDAVNQLSVRWTDVLTHEERTTAPIHALGAIDEAGVNAQTLDYLALPTEALALRKAEAELRARATPIARLTLTCTRKPWAWLRGDYFELQAPRHGIASMVCMVGDIDRGTLRSGAIKITALQDVYSLPATSYAQTQAPVISASATPVPVAEAALIEAPYAELVQALSPADLSVLAADAGYVLSLAVRPAAGLHNYRLLTRPSGGTYEDRGIVDWCPAATVVGASGYRDTAFTLSAGSLLDRVTIGTAALWGGTEIVRVDALNVGTGAVTLGRGCWDTVPRAHSAGERILFFDRWSGTDGVEYVDGDVVQVKQLPRSGTAVLVESAAPQLSITLDSRADRPYPPGDFQVNGEPDPTTDAAPLVCTWVHRDRLLQQDMLVDTEEAGIGPEAGTTYTLEATDADNDEVLHTETGITGTTFTVTALMIDFDRDVRLRLWAVRGGLESAQRHDLVVSVTGIGAGGSAWDPSDKDADITLSGGNRTASITSPAQGGVRGTQGRDASGDHYFEVTVGGTSDGRMMVGISQAGSSLIFPGFDAHGRGYWGQNGNKFISNAGSAYGATFGTGDVIGVQLNAGTLTFYKDGTSQGSAYTGLTGTWYPMCGTDTSVAGTRSAVIDTTPATVPSGSTAWG